MFTFFFFGGGGWGRKNLSEELLSYAGSPWSEISPSSWDGSPAAEFPQENCSASGALGDGLAGSAAW